MKPDIPEIDGLFLKLAGLSNLKKRGNGATEIVF